MQIICPTRSGLLYRYFQHVNRYYLTVSIPLMCSFEDDQVTLVDAQELWNVFDAESVQQFDNDVLDYILPKAEPEIIVNGYAYGVYAEPDNHTVVSVSLNNVHKALKVWGDRYWVGDKVSSAQAFHKIAISHYNAFGGQDVPENLNGKGRDYVEVDGEPFKAVANIESLGEPIRDSRRCYKPVGLSALPLDYPGRLGLLGTYDQHWAKTEFPGFAADVDWSYFNLSPQDQRLSGLKAGDVASFLHMHPQKSKLELTIPDISVRLFLNSSDNSDALQSVNTQLMSAWFYPHLEKAIFTYQGTIEVASTDDFNRLMVAVEREEEMRSFEYYQRIFTLRTSGHAIDYALVDSQLVAASLLKKEERDVSDPYLDKVQYGLEKSITEMETESQEKEDALKRVLADRKIDSEDHLEVEVATALHQEDELFEIEDFTSEEQVDAYVKQQENGFLTLLNEMRQQRRVKKELEKLTTLEPAKENDASDEQLSQLMDAKEKFLSNMAEFEEPREVVAVTTSEALACDPQLRELISHKEEMDWRAFFADESSIEPIHAMSSDARELESLFDCSERDEDTKDFLLIQNKQFSDENYSSLSVFRLQLNSLTFIDCDFSEGQFYGIRFRDCRFLNCQFDDADFERSRFESCCFDSCYFDNFDIDKVYSHGTSFKNCQIELLIHNRLTLESTSFEQCQLTATDFSRLKAKDLSFTECRLDRVLFDQIYFDGLSFEGCGGDSIGIMLQKPSAKLYFNHCHLDSFLLGEGSVISGLEINHSQMNQSTLAHTQLSQFQMTNTNFSHGDFEHSHLAYGKITDCFFDETVFVQTYFDNVLCEGLDCREADFKEAVFEGSVFNRVSFYETNLALIQVDKTTVFADDCFFAKANFYPRVASD